MRRFLKWGAIGVAGLAGLVLLAVATVYVASEIVLRRSYEVPLEPIAVPTDSASIAEGRRLATMRGCYDDCHGTGLDGTEFWDEPWIARLVAPNLTQVAAQHSDAELERIIRDGVRPGEFPPQAQVIDHGAARLGERPRSDTLAFGAYLARTICSECHGVDLRGDPRYSTPPLAIAAAYSQEEFIRLMRTGVALGGRELGLMTEVSRRRFIPMTDDELHALPFSAKTLDAAEQWL